MDAKNDLFLFITIIIGIGVVWVYTGGPERTEDRDLFIEQPAQTVQRDYRTTDAAGDETENVGTPSTRQIEREIEKVQADLARIQEELERIDQFGEHSPFENMVTIEKSTAGVRATKAGEEYITLRADSRNDKKVVITGWRIESMISGRGHDIGLGAQLPSSGAVGSETTIALAPGDRAIITTGRSPIGTSFRANICTGYFEQFQDFTPRLSRSCPSPKDELNTFGRIPYTDDSCYEYVNRIPRCTTVIGETPLLSSSCFEFLGENIHYTGCVKNHRADDDFFKSEWRIFLGRNVEQWRVKREVIRLLDTEGKIVDVFTY